MVSRRFVGEVLVLLLLLGGAVSLNSGCISSQLTNVWMDPSYAGGPIKTMLVVAVKKNPAARRIWEDALVAELSGHGVSPTPSYKLFPRAIPDTNEVGSAVEQNHIEGVLIVQRLPNQIATYDHPGSRKSVPVRPGQCCSMFDYLWRQVRFIWEQGIKVSPKTTVAELNRQFPSIVVDPVAKHRIWIIVFFEANPRCECYLADVPIFIRS